MRTALLFFIAAALAALLPTVRSCQAGELLVLGLSRHFNTDTKHEERNWGLGWHESPWSVGAYRNSYGRGSGFVSHEWLSWAIADGLTFELPLAVVTGYHPYPMPAVLPVVTYRVTGRLALDVLTIPPVGSHMGVLAAQLRISF